MKREAPDGGEKRSESAEHSFFNTELTLVGAGFWRAMYGPFSLRLQAFGAATKQPGPTVYEAGVWFHGAELAWALDPDPGVAIRNAEKRMAEIQTMIGGLLARLETR
jgi:hypothetical protein